MPTSHGFKHMGLSGYGTSKAVCCTQARHSLCHRTTYDLCAAPGSSWLLLGWCLYVFGVASTIDRSLSILQVMFGWAPVRKFLAWTRARTWMNQSSIKLCCVGFPTLECQQGFTLLNWGGYLFRWDHMVQKPWSSLCPLVLGKSVLSWAIVLKIQGGITWCFLLFFYSLDLDLPKENWSLSQPWFHQTTALRKKTCYTPDCHPCCQGFGAHYLDYTNFAERLISSSSDWPCRGILAVDVGSAALARLTQMCALCYEWWIYNLRCICKV